MARRAKSTPTAVGQVLPGLLRELGLGDAAAAARLSEAWGQVVGDEAAAHSWPAALRAGVLEVEVDASAWAQQLQLRRPQLLSALRGFFDGEADAPTIRDVRLRLGRPRSQA